MQASLIAVIGYSHTSFLSISFISNLTLIFFFIALIIPSTCSKRFPLISTASIISMGVLNLPTLTKEFRKYRCGSLVKSKTAALVNFPFLISSKFSRILFAESAFDMESLLFAISTNLSTVSLSISSASTSEGIASHESPCLRMMNLSNSKS